MVSTENITQAYLTKLSFSQAQKLITTKVKELFNTESEQVSIDECLDRVLAADVKTDINVPAFDNSAMDGYAIKYAELSVEQQGWLTLQKPQYAGDCELQVLAEKSAIPIMTGAMLPIGADTVVMKEHTQVKDGKVHLLDIGTKGQFIRKAGADIRKNNTILYQKARLTAADVGLIASVGVSKVTVYKKTQVILFTGGDEIIQADEKSQTGKVFDSVRPMLKGLLAEQNCDLLYVGNLKDDPEQIKQAFDQYSQSNTIIICCGGVSAGDKDYALSVMQEYGHIAFHKVKIKPGFPLLFGQYKQALFFGLPGNPVSSFTNYSQFLLPALRQLSGEKVNSAGLIKAKIVTSYNKTNYRREFVRARLSYDATFGFEVCITGNQSSGRLSSVTQANCFIVLNETPIELQSGDEVKVQRFADLFHPHLV